MKIKFNSDNDLPSKKILELCNIIIIVNCSREDNKYYVQVFLDECLYEL